MAKNSKQATGGSVKRSPGDKIKGAHVPKANPHRLGNGGSANRGKGY